MNNVKKIHVRGGDTVVVISGDEKGKRGKVLHTVPKTGRVLVEGVAMVTKHQKARGEGMQGGIIHKEAPIDASNVMLICPKCGKATRSARKILENGKKARMCKKCGAAFEK